VWHSLRCARWWDMLKLLVTVSSLIGSLLTGALGEITTLGGSGWLPNLPGVVGPFVLFWLIPG